jgi:S1-C subfamily serine protease
MEHGATGEGADDDGSFRAPLPPDDRLWRHPSEVAALAPTSPVATARRPHSSWSVGVVSGLIGSVLTFGLIAVSGALSPGGTPAPREVLVRESVRPAGLSSAGREATGVEAIAEEVTPAIVRIVAEGDVPSGGSGVMFRDNGYLLTNAHVVDEAERITVIFADGSELEGALVGFDTDTDVAVVKVERDEPFTVAALGTATDLRVGQATIAIGSPLGLVGGSSVTTGVVSQLGRVVRASERAPLLDMIQTDAAIAPGSSGGALLDGDGYVIGVTTAIAVSEVGAEGLGFAVPIDIARAVAEDIIATGSAVHVWLGIEGHTLGAPEADALGVRGGAVVRRVVDDSPAAGAGLEVDDVILTVSEEDIISMSALVIHLRRLDPGDEVRLGLVRDGTPLTVTVVLAQRP